jgi:bacteriorhodopsin
MTDTPEPPPPATAEPIAYATIHRSGGVGREIFGTIVRTFGLILMLWGIYCIAYIAAVAGFQIPQTDYSTTTYAVFGILYLGIGIGMLKGEWIVRFAYDEKRAEHRA